MTPVAYAWSYSRLTVYEDCPAKYKYKVLDRLPDPPSPAATRGLAVHKTAEGYLTRPRGAAPPREFSASMRRELAALRTQLRAHERAARGTSAARSNAPLAGAEVQLAFDERWRRVPWFDRNVWLRVVLDALVPVDGVRSRAIDFKTGRVNPSHREQLELYALAVFQSDEYVETVSTELWYVDHDERVEDVYERLAVRDLDRRWRRRAAALAKERRWKPKPGPSCRWCPYSAQRGGPCAAAVG